MHELGLRMRFSQCSLLVLTCHFRVFPEQLVQFMFLRLWRDVIGKAFASYNFVGMTRLNISAAKSSVH